MALEASPAPAANPALPSRVAPSPDERAEPEARPARWRPRLTHLLALLTLALLPPLASWTLLTPKVADRQSIAPGDFYDVHFPFHLAAIQAWQHGGPLLWTPNIDAGQPAFADIQFEVFYPVTVLTGLLLGPRGQFTPDLLVRLDVAHVFAGELGMYLLLLWLLGRRRAALLGQPTTDPDVSFSPSAVPAALTGAIIFACSGYLTTYPLQDVNILQVSIWLPWCLLLLDQALARRSTTLAVLTGFPAGLATLAGHPQVLLYLCCALALYVLVFAGLRARDSRFALATVARGAVALVVGLAAGAVQLLPTWQLAPYTVRGNVTYNFLSGGFLPHELVGLVLPKGFDGATPLYLGVAALALAALGLGAGPRDLRVFGALLGGLSLPLALGKYAALYPLAYLAVPGFAQVRDQERAIYLLTVAVAILAANGVQQALCRGVEVLRPWLRLLSFALATAIAAGGVMSLALTTQLHWGLAAPVVEGLAADREALDWTLLVATATLIVLGVASSLRRPIPGLAWCLAGLCAVDLLSAHAGYGTVQGIRVAYPTSPLIATVQADADRPFRISSEGLLPAGGNAGLVYGLEDSTGGTPLELQLFHDVQQLPELQRYALLNVRYVLTKRTALGDGFSLLGQQDDTRLFKLVPDRATPRAWMVHQADVVPPASLWNKLAGVDVRQEAVMAAPDAPPPLAPGEDAVSVRESGADRLDVTVQAGAPGLLVISQIRYPGWQATVDGQAAPLLSVDGALYGLPLGTGHHQVTLKFRPTSLRIGLALTTAAAALMLAVAVVEIGKEARGGRLQRRSSGPA